jgi:lipoprotein-releasing system ATP-binding protein
MLKAENIHKSYDDVEVLRGIDMHVYRGELVSIIGKSGSGKSTLLHILGTLDKSDQGKVLINNNDVNAYNEKQMAQFRNKNIGFVFQFHHLLAEFTALENAMIPALISKKSKSEAESEAKKILDYLGLGHRLTHRPSELSGGEQQRVAIARALINKPELILADEPTGNLDTQTSEELHDLFLSLKKDFNQTFIIVTHNKRFAEISDRQIILEDGLIKA